MTQPIAIKHSKQIFNQKLLYSNISEVAKNLGTQVDKHQKTFAEALVDHPADMPV